MTAYTRCEQCGMMVGAFDLKAHKCKPKPKTEMEILKDCLLAAQSAAIDLAKKNEALEKDLALKTRDRDVFRDFTLAYERRIEELEKQVMMYRTDAEKLTMRLIDIAVKKAQENA